MTAAPQIPSSVSSWKNRLGSGPTGEEFNSPFPTFALTSHPSHHGVQVQGSPLPRIPKSMDAQGSPRQCSTPTEPHRHRAHGHQAHCSTAPVPPRLTTLNALSHLNLISALFLFSPHCTACGIVVPRPGTEPVPPAEQIDPLSKGP